MSFFTSLTGLNAATTQLSVTSNNIANSGTTGFKRSRSDFGDIFATSPLQKASTVVGQGTALKQVTQEFSQGNIVLSGNSLDLAVTGEGFFPMQSADGQSLYTRNGSFLLDDRNTVVNSAGQFLQVASVDSLGKADFEADLVPLQIAPQTVGEAIATSSIDFEINFPGDSEPVYETDPETGARSIVEFNPNDPNTYAKSAAITIYDANGEDFLLTFYYRRTQVATSEKPESKWQTHILLNDQELTPTLSQATDSAGNKLFVNKYGVIKTENDSEVSGFTTKTFFKKYNLDDLGPVIQSTPATAIGSIVDGLEYQKGAEGVQFSATESEYTFDTSDLGELEYGGVMSFDISVAGGTAVTIEASFDEKPTLTELASAVDDVLASTAGTENVYASVVNGKLVLKNKDGASTTVTSMEVKAVASITPTVGAGGTALANASDITISSGSTGFLADDVYTISFTAASNSDAAYRNVVITPSSGTPITVSNVADSATSITVPAAAGLYGEFTIALGEDDTLANFDEANGTIVVDVLAGASTVLDGGTTTVTGSSAPDLTNAFSLLIDEDLDNPVANPVSIDLSALNDVAKNLSGQEVAEIMTSEINRQLGDGRYFDLSNATYQKFTVGLNGVDHDISIDSGNYTPELLAQEIQDQLRSSANARIDVEYDYAQKQFTFKTPDLTDVLSLKNTGTNVNTLFGLSSQARVLSVDPATGVPGAEVIPQGTFIRPEVQQRTGIKVEFFPNSEAGATDGYFQISSGTTGDDSSIQVSDVSATALSFFGFDVDAATVDAPLSVGKASGDSAIRGVSSTAAKVFGTPIQFDPDETFTVDDLSNEFTITIDNVTETFDLATGDYNLNSFIDALELRINAMGDADGNSISGAKVEYDETLGVFTITSGTTGDDSFVQIEGSPKFGLNDLGSSVGSTGTFRRPVAETSTANNQTVYVQLEQTEGVAPSDKIFTEYDRDPDTIAPEMPTDADGLDSEPEWRPLFLDKGELTFDTAGKLVSPLNGINLQDVIVGAEEISIDYAGSTQFTGDFSVNTQSQDGQPNGSLVSVDIADDGLVTASYSNGTQDLKGKIVLATFSTPNGLRQLGDSTFLESTDSGVATLGEPGGAGFGTIRAGALERANVDLTSELVDLITAQRNFQANAKAIETSSTLTSTIINIRS